MFMMLTRGFLRLVAGASVSLLIGVAVAQQQPYFRLKSGGLSGLSDGTTELTPPGTSPVEPIDFSEGGTADYRIRTVVGEPFSLELSTINGVAPISWLSAPADMPQGIGYADGILYGYAGAPFAGIRSFVALDSTGTQATGRVSFEIVDAAVSLSRVKSLVRVGQPYVGDLASNVRDAAYSLSSAPGLGNTSPDANSRASLSGLASAPGTFQITATVGRPGTSISAQSQTSTIRVAAGLVLTFAPSFAPSLAGTPVDIEARPDGVVGTGTLTLVSPTAPVLLQRGLTFAGGRLTGTVAQGDATTLTVKLTDSADSSSTTASLTIPASDGSPAVIEIGEIREGDEGGPARVATNILDPVCTTTQAVPGIVVTSDCIITGSPTSPGRYTLAVSIVPAASPQSTPVSASAPVVVHPRLTATSPAPSHHAAPGVPVNFAVSTSGIVGTPSFQLIGTTPEALAAIGLTFNPVTGSVTGTPDAGLDVSFEIEVTDSRDGAKARGPFSVITAASTASMDTSAVQLRPGMVVTRTATTNLANAVWSLVGAPSFVTIDPSTGVVTYTGPNLSEITIMAPFAVRASNAARPQLFRDVTVAVPGVARPALSLSIPDVSGTIGQAVSPAQVTLIGASQPRFNVTSYQLLGLNLSTTTLGGTPNRADTTQRDITVTDDADGAQATHRVTITIASTLTATGPTTTTYSGTTGQSITAGAPSHSGGVGNVSWIIQSTAGGPAPAGTSVNSTTGVVTATSASSGDLVVRLLAQDTIGSTVGQAATATSALTFQFRSADASVARPNSASVSNGGVVGSGGALAVLYDEPPYGSARTGVSLYSNNSSLTLTYTQPTQVDCVTITATRSSYAGNMGSLSVNSAPNGVSGTAKGTAGGVVGLTPGPTRTVTLSFSGWNNSAFVDSFRAGIMQPNGSCKTAP